MTPLPASWIVAGAAAGAMHSAGLWTTAHRWRAPSRATWWRLPLVAAALVVAGVSGGLLPAAGGWAGGFLATSAGLLLRSRR